MESDSSKSLAFKHAERIFYPPAFYSGDAYYQLYEQFQLVQKANQGDPLAQHELGIRYLNGDGFEKDTIKSFAWINKSADAGLPVALYNRGIFQTNGWGTEWNPFSAFKSFQLAAQRGFDQAKYVMGLLFTENLVVKKNLDSAYFYMRWAANDGFESAVSLSEEIQKRISDGESKDESNREGIFLNYIDFTADTIAKISDSVLIREFLASLGEDSLVKFFPQSWKSLDELEAKSNFTLLEKISEYGNPEALTLLAKYYQSGLLSKKDLMKSAELLLRAYRLESFRAASLLNELIANQKFIESAFKKSETGDPSAQYIVATLTALNFSRDLFKADVVSFYQKASDKNFTAAKIELAGILIAGNFTTKNIDEAIQLYHEAEMLGSYEAKSRMLLFELSQNKNPDVKFLLESEKRGSIVSQIALGYCYERGIGMQKDFGKAATYYRTAAFRGSRIGYEALKRIYDSLRPAEIIFQF